MWFLRLAAVYSVMMLLFFLSVTQMPMPMIGTMKPLFLLMAIYYWTIYRPSIIPSFLLFFLGLGIDFLAGTPLGLQSFVYLVIALLVRGQRRFFFSQSFVMVWSGFALTSLLASLMVWVLYSIGNMNVPPVLPVLGQAFISALLYPLVSLLLIASHRFLLSSRPSFS